MLRQRRSSDDDRVEVEADDWDELEADDETVDAA